jgi:hypothetical protein
MTWNEFVYGLGEFLEWTFGILPFLGNIPNILFSLVLLGGIVVWLMELKKYDDNPGRKGRFE